MANNKFNRLQYDSDYFFPRDSILFRIDGTQASKTSTWLGPLPEGVEDYFDGFTIDYFLPFDSGSAGVTLNLGGKGAKPVYYNNGLDALSQVTSQGVANTLIRLTYVIKSHINSGNGAWLVCDGMVSGAGVDIQKYSDEITEVEYVNGTAPTLEISDQEQTASFIENWDQGQPFSATVSGGVLKLTSGRAPTMSNSNITFKGVTNWDPGVMTTISDKATKEFLTDVRIIGKDD